MLIEGRRIPGGAPVPADLCIVGAGPAGLALAGRLAPTGLRVVLLESGDVQPSTDADALATLDSTSAHFPSPEASCHRQFGGMAASWTSDLLDGGRGARYVPLDPIDFESRHWVPHSGWPFGSAELVPYYVRARAVCGLAPFDFTAPVRAGDGLDPIRDPDGVLETGLDELGAATVFTRDALRDLGQSSSVTVITNASVASVRSAQGADRPSYDLTVNCRGGHRFTVAATAVAMAAGAIENARLLLNSTADEPAGLGNAHDNVGRYFMDHPRVTFGYGRLDPALQSRSVGRYEPHLQDGQEFLGKFRLADHVLRREGLLNGNARVFPHHLSVDEMRAVRAARRLRTSIRDRHRLGEVPRDVAVAGRYLPSTARTLLAARRRADETLPRDIGWGARTGARSFTVHYQPEQAPDRGNRVVLGERTDAFGVRVPTLHWRWSHLDMSSIARARALYAAALEAAGVGVLEPPNGADELPEGELGGAPTTAHHHMGTTRMHRDARHGVVDGDGRVHGTAAVYVTGASTFPTSGYANPTLTIVALALRLGDHLAMRLPALG
jgi:choline dehydrogenase-like flavoprotein